MIHIDPTRSQGIVNPSRATHAQARLFTVRSSPKSWRLRSHLHLIQLGDTLTPLGTGRVTPIRVRMKEKYRTRGREGKRRSSIKKIVETGRHHVELGCIYKERLPELEEEESLDRLG